MTEEVDSRQLDLRRKRVKYTTLRSTFGGINTIKYQHIGTQSAVVYDFYSTIIELVSILVRFKIKIPQRWYFLNNTIVFSNNTTSYTTERWNTVSTRDICRTEAKNSTRQIIKKDYSSIFQKYGLAALFVIVVSQ